jgi:hypothetical protein
MQGLAISGLKPPDQFKIHRVEKRIALIEVEKEI